MIGISNGTMALIINTHESTQEPYKTLQDINGIKNELFYEKKIAMKHKGKQIILDIAKFDNDSILFTTEIYTTKSRKEKISPQPINLLRIESQDSSHTIQLKIDSLFKKFLSKNNITNNNFQKK